MGDDSRENGGDALQAPALTLRAEPLRVSSLRASIRIAGEE